MAKGKSSKKTGTCLHALRRNKKEIAALFREMVLAQCMIWDKEEDIEKLVGDLDDLPGLVRHWAEGTDAADVEKISTADIITSLEGYLCTPDDPAPPED